MFGQNYDPEKLSAWEEEQKRYSNPNQLAGATGTVGAFGQGNTEPRPGMSGQSPPSGLGNASALVGGFAKPASVSGLDGGHAASSSFDPSGAPVAQAAPAGGGAGAAASTGAAAAVSPYLAVLASFMQKQQGDKLARQQMQQRILAEGAARNGAPTDSIEAAQLNRQIEQDPGTDYLAPILKKYGGG